MNKLFKICLYIFFVTFIALTFIRLYDILFQYERIRFSLEFWLVLIAQISFQYIFWVWIYFEPVNNYEEEKQILPEEINYFQKIISELKERNIELENQNKLLINKKE